MRLVGFLVLGLAWLFLVTSCGGESGLDASPTTAAELIHAMHAAYEGKWYEKLSITQRVEFYDEGVAGHEETWYKIIELPGKVRSNIGPAEFGNAEIFLHGTYYWFREGEMIDRRRTSHVVLLLGFDVYQQAPESTLAQLKLARFDLTKMHLEERDGKPVYVVGAVPGDLNSAQFWIDKETLTFVRQITTTSEGNIIDVDLSEFEPLDEGWIATRIRFRRDGEITLEETFTDYAILEEIDPAVFDVEYFTTEF